MKPFLLLITILLSSSVFSEDLKQVLDDALQNNSDYLVAQSQLNISEEYKVSARGLLLPSLNFEASHTLLDNTYKTGNSALSTASNVNTSTNQWRLTLEQTILNFTDWYAFKAGSHQAESGKIKFSQASQTLMLQTMKHYLSVVEAQEDLNVNKAEESALAKQLKRLQDQYDLGLVAITDLYEGQATYDLAKVNVLKAQRSVDARYKELTAFSGKTYQHLLGFSEQTPLDVDPSMTVEKWLETAMQFNHDLLVASSEKNIADYDYKSKKASHLPTLSLNALYSDGRIDGEQYNANIDGSSQKTQQLALTLRVPLYSGGSTSSQSRVAAAQRNIANDEYLGIKRKVEENIKGFYDDLVVQKLQIQAMQSAVLSSEKAFTSISNGFDQGNRSLLDVLNAQSLVYQAKRDLLVARMTFIELSLSLKKESGILTAEDVLFYNNWLTSL